MSLERVPGSVEYVNRVLAQLFHAHGINAVLHQGFVRFPAHPQLWMNGELYHYSPQIVQLDVRFGGFDGNRVLTESIGGVANDPNTQAHLALKAYANASFHVMVPAFFGLPACHGTAREDWVIGGRTRPAFPGLITTTFGYPPPPQPNGMPDLSFYPAFLNRLKTTHLPPGIHWVRIYQVRSGGEVVANEVLLDNQPWPAIESLMAEHPWPVTLKAYDVRVFLVIGDAASSNASAEPVPARPGSAP